MNLSVARRQQRVRLRNPSPDPLACSLNASHPNPKPKVRLQKLKPKPPLRPVIEWYMLLIVGCALYTWWCAPRKASTETKSSFGTDYGRAKKEFIARLTSFRLYSTLFTGKPRMNKYINTFRIAPPSRLISQAQRIQSRPEAGSVGAGLEGQRAP